MKTVLKLTLIIIFLTSLNAKIIDATQLFNKKITKVKDETVYETKSFYGQSSIAQNSVKDIVLRVDGYITTLNANKELMRVKKDEELFSIYSNKVQSIKKEIEISKSINTSLYKSSLAKLEALDIKLSQIKNSNVHFYSPFEGIVLNKKINNGSYVRSGTLLMQIASLRDLWFIAKVYQSDLEFLKKSMEGSVIIDGIKKSFKSKVDYIYPFANSESKTIDVRFIIENKDLKVFPNMFGKVLLKSTQKRVLTLPKTAVLSKGDKFYVFKPVSKDEFEPILIEAKRLDSSKYQIISGLEKDDEVINNALFLLDSDAVTNNLYDDEDEDW